METLPAYVSAELRVAAKIKDPEERRLRIKEVVESAMRHHPACFKLTQGNTPIDRIKTSFDKYMENVKLFTHALSN